MILMLTTCLHQTTKTATNKQIVKNIAQTFLKASLIILHYKERVEVLQHLDIIASIESFSRSLSSFRMNLTQKNSFQRWLEYFLRFLPGDLGGENFETCSKIDCMST